MAQNLEQRAGFQEKSPLELRRERMHLRAKALSLLQLAQKHIAILEEQGGQGDVEDNIEESLAYRAGQAGFLSVAERALGLEDSKDPSERWEKLKSLREFAYETHDKDRVEKYEREMLERVERGEVVDSETVDLAHFHARSIALQREEEGVGPGLGESVKRAAAYVDRQLASNVRAGFGGALRFAKQAHEAGFEEMAQEYLRKALVAHQTLALSGTLEQSRSLGPSTLFPRERELMQAQLELGDAEGAKEIFDSMLENIMAESNPLGLADPAYTRQSECAIQARLFSRYSKEEEMVEALKYVPAQQAAHEILMREASSHVGVGIGHYAAEYQNPELGKRLADRMLNLTIRENRDLKQPKEKGKEFREWYSMLEIFETAAKIYQKTKDPEKVQRVWDTLTERGDFPAYKTQSQALKRIEGKIGALDVLNTCAERDPEKQEELRGLYADTFTDLLSVPHTMAEKVLGAGLDPDQVTSLFKRVLQTCARGPVADVLLRDKELMKEVQDRGFAAVYARSLTLASKPVLADAVFSHSLDNGESISTLYPEEAKSAAFEAFLSKGEFVAARELAARGRLDEQLTSMWEIATHQLESGDRRGAHSILDEIDNRFIAFFRQPGVHVGNTMESLFIAYIRFLAEQGLIDRADRLLRMQLIGDAEMVNTAFHILDEMTEGHERFGQRYDDGELISELTRCALDNDVLCIRGVGTSITKDQIDTFSQAANLTPEQREILLAGCDGATKGDASLDPHLLKKSIAEFVHARSEKQIHETHEERVTLEGLREAYETYGGKEVAEMLGEAALQGGIGNESFARLLKETVEADTKTGTTAILNFLQRNMPEGRHQERLTRYLYRVMMQEGMFTQNTERFLASEHLPFLRTLLTQYPNQMNTVLDTIVSMGLEPDQEVKEDVLAALRDIGGVTPVMFRVYRGLEESERGAFVEKIRTLKGDFFKNKPVGEESLEGLPIGEGDAQEVLAEMIYLSYRPVGMSFEEVQSFVNRLEDHTEDLAEYTISENGYEIHIPKVRYELRGGAELDAGAIDRVKSHFEEAQLFGSEENIRALSQALQSVIRSGKVDAVGMSIIMKTFPQTDFLQMYTAVDPSNAHAFLLDAQARLDYAKSHLSEEVWKYIYENKPTLEKLEALLMKGGKARGRIANLAKLAGREREVDALMEASLEERVALVVEVFAKRSLEEARRAIKKELRKFVAVEEVDEENTTSAKAYISKNIASFFAKSSAGICTAADVDLFRRFDHFHINVVEGEEFVRGNVQAYIAEGIAGSDKKSLVLRGFNPNETFLHRGTSPEGFVRETLRVAREFADANEIDEIYVAEQGSWHALSNRPGVTQVFNRFFLKEENRVEQDFSITSTVTVKNLYRIPKEGHK